MSIRVKLLLIGIHLAIGTVALHAGDGSHPAKPQELVGDWKRIPTAKDLPIQKSVPYGLWKFYKGGTVAWMDSTDRRHFSRKSLDAYFKNNGVRPRYCWKNGVMIISGCSSKEVWHVRSFVKKAATQGVEGRLGDILMIGRPRLFWQPSEYILLRRL